MAFFGVPWFKQYVFKVAWTRCASFLYFAASVFSPEMVGSPKGPADMRGRRAERQERSRMARRAGARTLSETMHEGDGGASMRGRAMGVWVGGRVAACVVAGGVEWTLSERMHEGDGGASMRG